VSRALAALLVGLLFALPAAGSTSSARILFDEPHGSSFDLVEIDADATNYLDGPNCVQNTSAEIFDSDPVWSPDGNEIAYVKKVGQAENVWLMRPDGAAQRQVTSDGGEKAVPQLAAEGSPARLRRGRRRVHPPRGRFACADRHRRGAGLVAGRLADRVLGAGRHLDDRPGRSESGARDRHSTGLQPGLVAGRLDDRLRRDAVLALPTERLGADLVA
jgi:hypothetical protein